MTLVRVDDPSVLPLANSVTAAPNDTVVGIDFSGGLASVITQINTAFASTGMTASNPSGTTLEILDDGAANTVNVNSVSATATATSLAAAAPNCRCLPTARHLIPGRSPPPARKASALPPVSP